MREKLLNLFFKVILKTFFREIVIKNPENLPKSGPVIFTSNHPNALIDPLLIFYVASKFEIRFVAKEQLFRIPLLSWIMRWIGAIPVVRQFETKGTVDYSVFFKSCITALAKGDSIAIFPEGRSLPQPYMTSLKTGAARLFFMAREKGVNINIVPIGLNYEHGSVFRTPVVVSIAPPLDTNRFVTRYQESPNDAVRGLTQEIARILADYVFQTDSFRDRQLMLLLERIYTGEENGSSWEQRLKNLKKFEAGLKKLRNSHMDEIARLRYMLVQYENLSLPLEKKPLTFRNKAANPLKHFVKAFIGLPFAMLGVFFNFIPYQLCRLLVTYVHKNDESASATYKIIYSIVLFPLTFFFEFLLIHVFIDTPAAILFAILIIPLSYFTLFFFDWVSIIGWGIFIPSGSLGKAMSELISKQLNEHRLRIRDQLDTLAKLLDNQG